MIKLVSLSVLLVAVQVVLAADVPADTAPAMSPARASMRLNADAQSGAETLLDGRAVAAAAGDQCGVSCTQTGNTHCNACSIMCPVGKAANCTVGEIVCGGNFCRCTKQPSCFCSK